MAKQLTSQQFLEKLQQEAQAQARLEAKKILPKQLSGVASLVVNYSWQFLLAASFFLACAWQMLLS